MTAVYFIAGMAVLFIASFAIALALNRRALRRSHDRQLVAEWRRLGKPFPSAKND